VSRHSGSIIRIILATVSTWLAGALVAGALLAGVTDSDPSSSIPTLIGALGITAAVLAIAVSAPYAAIQARTADRAPLIERLPRHLSAPTLVLPLASTFSGTVLTLSVLLFSLTLGDDPAVATTWRLHAGMFGVLAIAGGCFGPVAAFKMIQEEYDGLDAPIFDSKAEPERVRAAVAERWDELASRRRIFLRQSRLRALADLSTDASARAWPRNWKGMKVLRPAWVYATFTAIIAITFSSAFIIDQFTNATTATMRTLVIALMAVGIAATVSLAMVLSAHTRLQGEQGRADMLRAAYHRAASAAADSQQPDEEPGGPGGPLVADATRRELLNAIIKRRST
jgi:hypothetical protein